jgi:protein disulfide-isomerase
MPLVMRYLVPAFLVILSVAGLSFSALTTAWGQKDEQARGIMTVEGYEDWDAAEAIDWKTNFEDARMQAGREGKTLLLNFTGSDWCGWCMRLDREVFSKPEFIAYAKEKLVCVKLDFPKRKQLSESEANQNNELAMKYGIQGFPTVLLVDGKGKLLLETGYQFGGAQAYVKHLQKAMR